ncbi:MAG: hypothetical protein ACJ75F_08300 [Flavisolibacter sp.]
MAVVINEVIVRAVITGDGNSNKSDPASATAPETIAAVTKNELLELIDEVINDKKER